MGRVTRYLYFLIIFIVSSCYLVAIQNNGNSVNDCARSCWESPTCGWIVLDGDTCHANSSINCTLVAATTEADNERLLIYRRLHSGLQPEGCGSRIEFARITPADTCTTSMSCDTPPSDSNAVVKYSTLFPGSRAKYICKHGFSFCGRPRKEVDCLSNGSWEELGGCVKDTWVKPETGGPLNCNLTVGTVIEFIGKPTTNTHCSFNLYHSGTCIMLVDIRFTTIANRTVALSHQRLDNNNRPIWEEVVNANKFPFEVMKEFKMEIFVDTSEYKIKVDGVNLVSYPHRQLFTTVDSIKQLDDCVLISAKVKYNV